MKPVDIHLDSANRLPSSSEGVAETAFRGTFRGEEVHLTLNPSSRIEDAAEELTFTIAEESEKSLARREIQAEGGQSRQLEQIGKIEELAQLQEMQRKLPDLDAGKLARLRQRLRQMSQRDGKRCLGEADKFFPDPSLQYGALRLLERETDDTQLARDLQDAQAILIDHRGSEVRAGLNVSTVAAKHAAPGLGELQKLRADYREMVLASSGIAGLYSTLLEKYGRKGLEAGVRYLLAALAADLGADSPSIERSRLQVILGDMVRLETVSTLLENGDRMLARLSGRGLAGEYDSHALVGDFLAILQQQWLQPQQVVEVGRRAGMARPQDRIYFLREFTALVRQVPLPVYDNSEQRDRLLSTVQEALDKVIAEE